MFHHHVAIYNMQLLNLKSQNVILYEYKDHCQFEAYIVLLNMSEVQLI